MDKITVGSIIYKLGIDGVNAFYGQLESVSKEVKSFGQDLQSLDKYSQTYTKTVGLITAALTAGLTAMTLTAARTETLGVAMEAVGRSTGTSLSLLKEQEATIKKQGIATQEAREILTRFMQSELDVAQASKVARVAQDAAVIANKNSSETAQALTEGIAKQNVEILRTAGITISAQTAYERYADTLGVAAEDLSNSAKSQALLNEVLRAGSKITGIYEAAMETAGKKLTSLPRLIQEASNAIGDIFLPVLNDAIDAISKFLKQITSENIQKFIKAMGNMESVIIAAGAAIIGGFLPHLLTTIGAFGTALLKLSPVMAATAVLGVSLKEMAIYLKETGQMQEYLNAALVIGQSLMKVMVVVSNAVATAFASLISAGYILGKVISTVVAAAIAALSGNFSLAKNVLISGFEDIQSEVKRVAGRITTIWSGETKEQTATVKGALDEQVQAQKDKEEEIAASIKKETEDFKENMEERRKAFIDQLADIIWAHQDKVESLKEDITEEDKSYEESLAKRVEEFKESMEEMAKDHEEKTAEILADIAEEKEDYAKTVSEKTADAKDEIDEETKDYEEKVEEIQTLIDKEVAKGKNASSTKLKTLREELADEKEAYEEKVADIQKSLNKELASAASTNAEKLANLQENLDEENTSYTESVLEKTTAEQEATDELKVEHEERLADYQEELDSEQKILSDHEAEIALIKDKARDDDITRLVNQYNEENQKEIEQYNKRVATAQSQGSTVGNTLGTSINSALSGQAGNISSTMSGLGSQAKNSFAAGGGGGGSWGDVGKNWINNLFSGISNALQSSYNWLVSVGKSIASTISSGFSSVSLSLPHFAGGVENFGGGLAVVGEQGPELVSLPKGSSVIPNNQIQSAKSGVTQDIKINIGSIKSMQDIDALGRELGFRASMMPAS